MNSKAEALKELRKIPGVGKVVALDLWNMGYTSIEELKGQDPEELYLQHNDERGQVQDICMLYVFRCAVYFANTLGDVQDPEKLKWWYWTDNKKSDSKTKRSGKRRNKSNSENQITRTDIKDKSLFNLSGPLRVTSGIQFYPLQTIYS